MDSGDASTSATECVVGPWVTPKTVFYTTILGGYDDLPTFTAFDEQARYLCFSDTLEDAPPPWEVVRIDPFFADNKVTNGFLKSNAHILFDDDCVAVWVDANLNDVTLSPSEALDLLAGRSIAVVRHNVRESIAEEAAIIASHGLDYTARVDRLQAHLSSVGFPDSGGLAATMLLIRDLRDPLVTEFETAWWDGIARFSRRDQLTFDYALWQSGQKASWIPVDWQVRNRIFVRVGHSPAAGTARPVAAPGSPPPERIPDLLEPRRPNLPPEYPDIRVRHPESWNWRTLALLRGLNRVVSGTGELLEGNYCHFHEVTVHGSTPPDPRRSWKREFLRHAVGPAKRVLEIGFNAGHSAAIILGSDSGPCLVSIDLGSHSYARGCAQVLLDAYPGRFESRWGASSDVLPTIAPEQAAAFDLVHIDGGHGEDVFEADLAWFTGHVRPGCRLLVDDAYVPYIHRALEREIQDGRLCEARTGIPSSGENRLFSLRDRAAT